MRAEVQEELRSERRSNLRPAMKPFQNLTQASVSVENDQFPFSLDLATIDAVDISLNAVAMANPSMLSFSVEMVMFGMKILVKPSKCSFAMQEVNYLGFRISQHGIQATLGKIEAIMRVPLPVTTKHLYSFLQGMIYYASLIPNWGELTESLYALCAVKKRFCQWTHEGEKAFSRLKQALTEAPILAYPDYSFDFRVESDASDKGISAVLLQVHNGKRLPIAFAGRKLTRTEQKYSVSERELLGVVYAYDQFYHHIYGRHVDFFTDHKPLVTACRLKHPHGRLGRLFHRLSGVDHTLSYIPGSENYLADFISRSYGPEVASAVINFTYFQASIDWSTEQQKDQEVVSVTRILGSESIKDWEEIGVNGRRWYLERKQLYLSDNILMHSQNRIVVPRHLTNKVTTLHHDSAFAGHRMFEPTYFSVKSRYFWILMAKTIREFCISCDRCQKFNHSCLKYMATLKPIEVSKPLQLVGVDFMGPFVQTHRSNVYIIIAIDHFTKFIEGTATVSFDAETTGFMLFNQVICRHGMFEKLLSDQGVNFESRLISQLCTLLNIEKLRTTTYHPEGNGITERSNRSIKPSLAKFVNENHSDWDMYLPMAISAYNNSYHESIKMTPFEALYGRPSVQVADIITNRQLPPNTKLSDVASFTKNLRIKARYICDIIQQNTDEARLRQKLNHDQRITKEHAEYHLGDYVLINNFRSRPGHSKCFEPKFCGPYKIVEIKDLTYKLVSDKLRPETVHINRLKPYHSRMPIVPMKCYRQLVISHRYKYNFQ